MFCRVLGLFCLTLSTTVPAIAQSPPPAGPGQPPGLESPTPQPPDEQAPIGQAPIGEPQSLAPPPATAPAGTAPAGTEPGTPQAGRVFCEQNVNVELADPATVPEPYRRFLGIWSDAAWDAHTCAALIVERIKPDGAASIIYVFGPQGSGSPGPGGVLHGTGVIRGGELRFQNSDGSQFAFQPGIVDMTGHLINPQGESFAATFKQTP